MHGTEGPRGRSGTVRMAGRSLQVYWLSLSDGVVVSVTPPPPPPHPSRFLLFTFFSLFIRPAPHRFRKQNGGIPGQVGQVGVK